MKKVSFSEIAAKSTKLYGFRTMPIVFLVYLLLPYILIFLIIYDTLMTRR